MVRRALVPAFVAAVAGACSPAPGGPTPDGGDVGTGGTSASGGQPPAPSGGASPGAGGTTSGGGTHSGGNTSQDGGTSSGGAVTTGGAPPSGGSGGSGGSVELSPWFPAPDSTDQCPDPSIRLRFDGPPSLGTSGTVRVYDAASPGAPVATIDLALSQVTDTIGGQQFTLPRPAYVDQNEAIFLLPSAGLDYGHTYYVTIDDGVVTDPNGDDVVVTDPNAWRFTVASAAPTDVSELQVALDGSGQFCGVQAALERASTDTTIHIEPGAYYGVLYVTGKSGLTLVGQDRDTTRILGVNNNNLNPSTRGRALFGTEDLSELTIESVTIENLTPQDGSQAEALVLLSCDQCIVRDSTIRSLQDTLLWSGRIYAEDGLIEGNVDYIWGTGAVYFNRMEIRTVGRKGYNVQARNPANGYGYVFVDSVLSAEAGITGDVLARIDVSAYPASHVAYVDCEMGPHISAAGWTITGGGSTSQLRFWEYKSTDPNGNLLDTSGRAAGSHQMTDQEAAQMRDAGVVLGGWDPR